MKIPLLKVAAIICMALAIYYFSDPITGKSIFYFLGRVFGLVVMFSLIWGPLVLIISSIKKSEDEG